MGHTSGKQDLAAAMLIAAVAFFCWFWVRAGSAGAIADAGGVTHATMPSIYAAALLILASLLAVHALIRIRREDDRSRQPEDATAQTAPAVSAYRFVGTVAALLVYAGFLGQVPLSILTVGFLFFLFWLYGHRRWLTMAVAAIIGGAAIDVLFIRVLHVPL